MSWWPFGKKRKATVMAKIDELTAQVQTLTAHIAQVPPLVQGLQTQVQSLTAQVAQLQAAGGTPDSALEPLRAELADADAKLAAVLPSPTPPAPVSGS